MEYPKIYNNWTALYPDEKNSKNLICQCICGETKSVNKHSVTSGDSKSCGCSYRKYGKIKAHDMPEYNTWHLMRSRCNPSTEASRQRKNYAKKNIIVCDEWLNSFDNFYRDMGPKPSPKHSIDRINNDGNYCPENCRWATSLEQNRNRDSNHLLSFMGESLPISAWSEISKLNYNCLLRRSFRGWTDERALTTPMRGVPEINPLENIKAFFAVKNRP